MTRLPVDVLWGEAAEDPGETPRPPDPPRPPRRPERGLTLTVVNQTPDPILVKWPGDLLCGGQNRFFRARTTQRSCTATIETQHMRNPYAVPKVTLVTYFPSGDPSFPRNGRVVWTDTSGEPLDCGPNAHDECWQVSMGQSGSTGPGPVREARPASMTVRAAYMAVGVARLDPGRGREPGAP